MVDALLKKIEDHSWTAGVFGLGYVGLPLVMTLARSGVDVTGIDVSSAVVDSLRAGRSHIDDVTDEDLKQAAARTSFSTDPAEARERDVLFICVPTPLAIGKLPDISYVELAAKSIASVLRPGQLVILESTTYPGTTEDAVRSILDASGLQLDRDYLLAYSPERVDPGNASFGTSNIPRVVGGASPTSGEAAAAVYRRFVGKVFPVTDARTAEMAKLLENTFRWVNIALVNELSTIARGIGVNIWEVIDAAATKPFGFMPFYPGPGVGGHCIPLDPFYLQWAARIIGASTRFVELADTVNTRMPHAVVDRVRDALNEHRKPLNGSSVLVLGVAYKPNVRDYRESPSLEVIRFLEQGGAVVSYHDPFVPHVDHGGVEMSRVPFDVEHVRAADCCLILTDHDGIDYSMLASEAQLIVDTRNAMARRGTSGANVHLL